jgi:hypothetical protein
MKNVTKAMKIVRGCLGGLRVALGSRGWTWGSLDLQHLFLSNLFLNISISKWLDAEGLGCSHFLLIFPEIPLTLKFNSQGASQHSLSMG